VARNNRHNVAFVVGSVLGAVVGAAAALWKTPYSGEELRTKLSSGSAGKDTSSTAQTMGTTPTASAASNQRSVKDKLLSGVEKTLAPVVGVELGRTANASGTMGGTHIKVNADVAASSGAATPVSSEGGDVSLTHAADGSEMIGLSRDKVDANKWAAAYAGSETATSSSSGSTGAAGSTPTSTTSQSNPSATSGQRSSLRHQHAWRGDASADSGNASVTHAADGSEMIGLSRDKVDADKWAAAYAGQDLDNTSTASTSGTGSSSKADESARQTGLGAAPAYPGDDLPGHAPADDTAPDSSVGEVSGRAADRARGNQRASTDEVRPDLEAASVDQLTTPAVETRSEATPGVQHEMHPFPKLGGIERN
jgi:gas vesicle protein